MNDLIALWQPIVVSAVIVHVASAVIWMASPLHKKDYRSVGDKEKSVMDYIRSLGLAPGAYVLPWCGEGVDRKSPEFVEKMKQAPVMVTLVPGPMNMATSMIMWIVNLLIVGVFVAYIASNAGLPGGAAYLKVFRVVGATAFLAHAGNALTGSIWMGVPWGQVPGRIVDGLIYALLTAGTFAWLWPKGLTSTM